MAVPVAAPFRGVVVVLCLADLARPRHDPELGVGRSVAGFGIGIGLGGGGEDSWRGVVGSGCLAGLVGQVERW